MSEINPIAQAKIDKIAEACKRIKPRVAIKCTTYNHESYIRDALEGFIMQKTDFPFVAIIHDDASTDRTAAIIHEYAKKYPDIILPIFEKENQYSKPDGSLRRVMHEAVLATGAKYIAICEGDDYWISNTKLQQQIYFLDSNPDYGMCFTNSKVLKKGIFSSYKVFNNSKAIDIRNMIIGGGGLCPTATIVLRADIFYECNQVVAPLPIGDYPLQVYCAFKAKVRYLNIITSVYRFGNEGSWTVKSRRENDIEYRIRNSTLIDDELNRITLGKHKKLFKKIDKLYCFKVYFQNRKFLKSLSYIGGLIYITTAFKYFYYIYKLRIKD